MKCCLLAFLLLLCPLPALAHPGLVVALQLEPPNLDPTSGAAAAVDEVTYGTIFETLVKLDAQGQVKPGLAASWTISPDGLTYVFRLRPGVGFHDGAPFDASAAAFSLRRIAGPGSSNVQATAFAIMRSVDVLDVLTLRVTLSRRDADFLRLLSYGDADMVSPRSVATLATDPIGTGPFRFSSWRRDDAIALIRNDRYWGTSAREPLLTFHFIADASAAFAAMKAHDADLFPDFPAPETLAQLRTDPSLKVVVGPTEGQVILAFNQRNGPLADLRVRRAISYALDRRAVIVGAMYGYGVPIGSHFAPQDPDYVDLTGRYPHDPAMARRLLAQAGYGQGLSLSLKLPPPSYARRSGEIVAAQLAAVGIHVVLSNIEWAQWLDEVYGRHAFDLTIIDHAEPYDYDIYGRDGYYFGYHGADVKRLLAALQGTDDPGQRHALLGTLQRRLADDAANGFLFEFPRLGVQDATLTDAWVNTPNQSVDFATAHLGGPQEAINSGRPGAGGYVAKWTTLLAVVAVLGGLVRFMGLAQFTRRIGVLIVTMLAATVLIFLLVQIAPGDPAAFMMGLDASPQAVAALHTELGLTGPPVARYFSWLGNMLRGDFGLSYTYRAPVAGLIAERLAVSVPLTLFATLFSILIGIPLGALAARGQGGAFDRVATWSARIGIAVPSFWLAILLVLLFSVTLHWLPSGGFPGWTGVGQAMAALLLPVIALGLPQAAILARVTRTALIEQLAQDYVRTARAKGISADRALLRHALPNALGPVAVVLGLQVPFLLAGSAIVENVFLLPGLGRLLLQAVAQRDLIVVQAVVVLLVAAAVLASFAADVTLTVIDPRLRRDDAR